MINRCLLDTVFVVATVSLMCSCVVTKKHDKEQVDIPPSFEEGNTELYKYISENFVYPEKVKTANITGKHIVEFVVKKNGNISDIKFIKSIGFGLDEELVRVLESMPKWTPAEKNGRKVNCRFTLPVSYE